MLLRGVAAKPGSGVTFHGREAVRQQPGWLCRSRTHSAASAARRQGPAPLCKCRGLQHGCSSSGTVEWHACCLADTWDDHADPTQSPSMRLLFVACSMQRRDRRCRRWRCGRGQAGEAQGQQRPRGAHQGPVRRTLHARKGEVQRISAGCAPQHRCGLPADFGDLPAPGVPMGSRPHVQASHKCSLIGAFGRPAAAAWAGATM